jgi:hypothetical protein
VIEDAGRWANSLRMISSRHAVNTNRHALTDPLKLSVSARFHTGPDKVHSERCPVKRASFRDEPGAILNSEREWPRFTFSLERRRIRGFQSACNVGAAIQCVLVVTALSAQNKTSFAPPA